MGRLEGKVVVITGGTRGFGLATARACAREGATVVVSSRTAEAVVRAVAELAAAGAPARGWACDVSDLAQVRALGEHTLSAFGRIDAWVNNAGVSGPYGPSAHIDPAVFRRVVETIVHDTHHGSIVALEHFLARGEGRLVNVLGWGARQPIPYQNAYAASKAWVRNFSLALAREYRDSGVGIYAIAPGMMPTDLVTDVEAVAGYERRVKALEVVLPAIGHRPERAAEKMVWLLSAATDGKTGLEVNLSSRPRVLLGFIRQGVAALLRLPGARQRVDVTVVPSAIPASVARTPGNRDRR